MYAIEFQATIKNGVIEIPHQYRKHLSKRVRVILLVEEAPKATENFIDRLLAHPVKVAGFRPLTSTTTRL